MLSAGLIFVRLVMAHVAGAQDPSAHAARVKATIEAIAKSGRCVTLTEPPDERVAPRSSIPPGKPPLLSFRYYEMKAHYGTGNSGLMLDDAGH
jgi:hypothetical protein